ncbi:MAG: HAD-IA family hydrolase [Muribaculaceae bacterium]|nr:HAD-IA family hydrolase [Muribaculaceae bacterium]
MSNIKAALIDMDGVLYDSMKYHTLAWYKTISGLGISCSRDEFYLYEGMTGPETINLVYRRQYGKDCDEEQIKRIYTHKSNLFRELGKREKMPGADILLEKLKTAGVRCILVTGSSQTSLLDSIILDYPGFFNIGERVTGLDVMKGKPDPEPYLRGLELAGVNPDEAIVIENAPLGIRSGKAAGIFTVAITTGPIPRSAFEKEGADIIFSSMKEAAEKLTII